MADDLKVHSEWPFVASRQTSGSRVVSVTTLKSCSVGLTFRAYAPELVLRSTRTPSTYTSVNWVIELSFHTSPKPVWSGPESPQPGVLNCRLLPARCCPQPRPVPSHGCQTGLNQSVPERVPPR